MFTICHCLAFLGALYIDKDLEFCATFCKVCFFPRLKVTIGFYHVSVQLKIV